MIKVRVINKGKKVRDRLGLRFIPNIEQEIEVTKRQLVTVRAVRDFEVEIIGEEEVEVNDINNDIDNNTDNDTDKKPEDDSEGELSDIEKTQELQATFNKATIEEILKFIENEEVHVDEAIALETVGKNRPTLLDKLEEIKQGE